MTSQQPRKRHRRPPADIITPETPIWCPACEAMHPASAFNRESRRFSGPAGICREAQARARRTPEGAAATVARNKRRWADPEYRARSLEWQRERRRRQGATVDLQRARRRLQAIVDEWKQQGCVDCGYDTSEPSIPTISTAAPRTATCLAWSSYVRRQRASVRSWRSAFPRCARCHRRVTQRPCAWRTAARLPPSWRRRLEAQDRNDEIKLERGCADCGWAKWAHGLDWDHIRVSRSPAWPRSSPTAARGARSKKRWPSATSCARTAIASAPPSVGTDMVPRGRSGRTGKGTGRQSLIHLCDSRSRRVTRSSVERAVAAGAVLPSWLREILDQEVRFADVLDRSVQLHRRRIWYRDATLPRTPVVALSMVQVQCHSEGLTSIMCSALAWGSPSEVPRQGAARGRS